MIYVYEAKKVGFLSLLFGLAILSGAVFVLSSRDLTAAPETAVTQPGSTIYDAGRWIEMGSGSASGGGLSQTPDWSYSPALAFDRDGSPVIAWCTEYAPEAGIQVRRWDGAAWAAWGSDAAPDGGLVANSAFCPFLSLAVGHDGSPIVTWNGESHEIYVRRWDGAAWAEMGAGSASGGGISNNDGSSFAPSLAVGPGGMPVVAWYDWSFGSRPEIYVRRWNGASWVEMGPGSASGGGISDSSGGAYDPSLAIGPDGLPIVAWSDDKSGPNEIYVKRWDGAAWVEMGPGSASAGGISQDSGYSVDPSLAISPAGEAMIAWADYSADDAEIYVRRWDGDAWVEVGAGSASAGGISDNQGDSLKPSLAFDPAGMPVVTWYDYSPIVTEIYVRRWDGDAWVEVGDHSASAGGISHNPGSSEFPSAAVDRSGTLIVAWEDYSDTGYPSDIYVRRWQPAGNYVLQVDVQGEPPGPDLNSPLQEEAEHNNRVQLPVILAEYPPFTGPREQEPNDDFSSANGPLRFSASYLGSFTGEGDTEDYYFFKLPYAQSVVVTLSEIPVGENIDLYLLDAAREMVASSTNGAGMAEKIQLDLAGGRYYVRIKPAGS